jgi:hypothetical protein
MAAAAVVSASLPYGMHTRLVYMQSDYSFRVCVNAQSSYVQLEMHTVTDSLFETWMELRFEATNQLGVWQRCMRQFVIKDYISTI